MDARNLKDQRVAIYARYSSDSQREASIDDQVRRCRAYIECAGGTVDPNLIFADHAVSGATLNRPAFEKLIGLVEARPRGVDAIVTEDLSRVTRDFADGAMIFKKLQFLRVPLLGVADGIDTSARGAKMNYTLKNLLADIYLDELRDKTLRGLEGRALAGYSTGGLPYGYRSSPETDAQRRVVGHTIAIDEAQSAVVRRIFDEYLAGRSFAAIAIAFNREGVPPPRAHTAHRRKGWVASTVRSILHNRAYIGEWSFKRREWQKVPGTNKRRPRPRAESDVMVLARPHLRLLDQETWEAVQLRLREVRAHFTKSPDGKPKGRSAPGGSTPHLLSGLLVCGGCGAPMVITGGNPVRYYGCADHHKRGTCPVRLSVREDVARRRILGAVRERLASEEGITYVRTRVMERLGEFRRTLDAQLHERRERLARTERRVEGLVTFIADGDRSDAVVKALRDLELQARTEKEAIAEMERRASQPLRLPSPDQVLDRVFNLEARLAQDVLRGREALRRMLKDGEIRLHVRGDHYTARMGILPLVLLTPESTMPGSDSTPSRASYSESCGGRI